MILEIMRETGNFFVNPSQIEQGKFKIDNGVIQLRGRYLAGQYLAVTGSILSSGIYLLDDTLYTLAGAFNEEFEGTVYGLVIPNDFLTLVAEIEEFQNNPQNKATVNVSESFGIDSRSKATGRDGAPLTWQGVFASRLMKYRKMFTDIDI